jgi:superfamily II RNA helicase
MVKICSENTPPESYDTNIDELYGFKLSNFQKHAIEAIHTNNHVLITAHTGSGKTLPAEYAINHFFKKGKKVIYTSPIKALSNQKFHEFSNKYPDISFGILTGDIKFNPEADVIIMTTEILRNQIFHSAFNETENKTMLSFDMDLENDLGCVIFDEVHYINDKDRGKIWEETILNMPKNVQMVMLSATIDHPEKFAEWIETRDDNKIVYLTTTIHRVVPLYHHGYITVHDSYTKKIKDETIKKSFIDCVGTPRQLITDGKFDDKAFYKIQKINAYVNKLNINIKRSFVLNSLVGYLQENNLLPAITFIFSRNQVERAAAEINFSLHEQDSEIPRVVEHECERIIRKLPNSKEYLDLPEYKTIIRLLQKGIAFHHAGMLPVFREMVELLFAKKYIKLLVATETFAVGINMPTKSVIFTSLRKFDGTQTRALYSHEYTQMAGRAGRRGIDTEGHVIHCNNLFDDISAAEYRNILCGSPQKIVSKFNISYNLILNLIANHHISQTSLEAFTEKSLMQIEIKKNIEEICIEIQNLETQENDQKSKIHILHTPVDVCNEYIRLMNSRLSNKERKKAIRRISEIEEEYKFLKNDIVIITELNDISKLLEAKQDSLRNVKTYVSNQINQIVNILQERSFINYVDQQYIVTYKGIVSTHIQEIPGHIFSELLMKYDYFRDLDAKHIAAIFSCFTNITVKDNQGGHYVDDLCTNIINDLRQITNEYYKLENSNKIDIAEDYEFHTNIVNEIIEWCDAENETECKVIVASLNESKGIFLGDFIKAILKINNIASELLKLTDLPVALHHKLSMIKDLTQKFVVTNQSLYI